MVKKEKKGQFREQLWVRSTNSGESHMKHREEIVPRRLLLGDERKTLCVIAKSLHPKLEAEALVEVAQVAVFWPCVCNNTLFLTKRR